MKKFLKVAMALSFLFASLNAFADHHEGEKHSAKHHVKKAGHEKTKKVEDSKDAKETGEKKAE